MSSHPESPYFTTLRFVESWRQDQTRLKAELTSLNKETHRIPDVYHFQVDETLIDPETERPIFDFIAPGIEYDIAKRLEKWALENDEGVAFWVSPRLEGIYPCNKIIIHTICYTLEGKKVILNSAILFDGELSNPEELRRTLFFAPDNDETFLRILNWIENISHQKIQNRHGRHDYRSVREQANYFANLIRTGYPADLVVYEMQKSGFLGPNPVSCPSFSGFLGFRSKIHIFEGKRILCCRCPFCGREVAAEIYEGKIHCPNCGRSKPYVM